jgi:hypothetical protein
MIPGSPHTLGVTFQELANPGIILQFVGTWSEHDPSWEVRTFVKNPYRSALSPLNVLNLRPGAMSQSGISRSHTDAGL